MSQDPVTVKPQEHIENDLMAVQMPSLKAPITNDYPRGSDCPRRTHLDIQYLNIRAQWLQENMDFLHEPHSNSAHPEKCSNVKIGTLMESRGDRMRKWRRDYIQRRNRADLGRSARIAGEEIYVCFWREYLLVPRSADLKEGQVFNFGWSILLGRLMNLMDFFVWFESEVSIWLLSMNLQREVLNQGIWWHPILLIIYLHYIKQTY